MNRILSICALCVALPVAGHAQTTAKPAVPYLLSNEGMEHHRDLMMKRAGVSTVPNTAQATSKHKAAVPATAGAVHPH